MSDTSPRHRGPSPYICPRSGQSLYWRLSKSEAKSSNLETLDGRFAYGCQGAIAHLLCDEDLAESDIEALTWYENNSKTYDEYLPLTFETFGVSEPLFRQELVDLLDLKAGCDLLEVGCGTGLDSLVIANRLQNLGGSSNLYFQDISTSLIEQATKKLIPFEKIHKINFATATATNIPLPDKSVDRLFHFGGLNTFGDLKAFYREAIRVVRKGGIVVVGDESMPPWLRETYFGKVLMNSNPHYRYELNLSVLPVEARDVSIHWKLGGVFYVVRFEVGDGEPTANFDFLIPGARGGTHRTRFEGQIEGVDPLLKTRVLEAAKSQGMSLYEWLNEALKRALS